MNSIQLDRAIGAVVASAAGDALGSQYEFGPAHPDDFIPLFGRGVFGHDAGEWTDDTSMALPILEALASGRDLLEPATQAQIVTEWIDWSRTSKDVGAQTRSVLSAIGSPVTADAALQASRRLHEHAGRSGGNGSLMRTGPVALGFLDRAPAELVEAASAIARLTHWEDDNADACALWCLAIRHAILTGELDMRAQVAHLPAGRRERWLALIDAALGGHPHDFQAQNGWVVRAFQGALAAVVGAESLTDAVHRAIRGGGDTDTVAAIAGSLAGAVWGLSAVPLEWQRRLHGWPGYRAADLVRRAALAARTAAGPRHRELPSSDASQPFTHQSSSDTCEVSFRP